MRELITSSGFPTPPYLVSEAKKNRVYWYMYQRTLIGPMVFYIDMFKASENRYQLLRGLLN